MKIKEDSLQEIKNATDIVDLISETVKLKKTGSSYQGLCPFHNEKSPSFSVSKEKQIFRCFGCGEAGNVFSFIMKSEGIGFVEAAKKLAERSNIEIIYDGDNERHKNYVDRRKRVYSINKEAARFYYKQMFTSKEANEYFKERGIDFTTQKKFGLGFAVNSWNSLRSHLKSKGASDSELIEYGLVVKNDKGNIYDRFRNRIMFPIFDVNTNVIGFGGRVMDNSKPKYLNSPETMVFKKGIHLYGLNFALKNGNLKEIIIVEGYMDCISLSQFGITNVVATLGVALSSIQARLIRKYVDTVIVSFDADEAGQTAALRGIEILKNEGLKVKVLNIEDGKDPDEYIRKNGAQLFKKLINESKDFTDYVIESKTKKFNLEDNSQKTKYIAELEPYFSILNSVEMDIYIGKISDNIGVRREAIYEMLQHNANNKKNMHRNNNNSEELYYDNPIESGFAKAERTILSFGIKNKKNIKYLNELNIESVFLREKTRYIFSLMKENIEMDSDKLVDMIEIKCGEKNFLKEFALVKEFNIEVTEEEHTHVIKECVKLLENKKLEIEKEKLVKEMKNLEGKGEIEKSEELARKIFEINEKKKVSK